MNEKILINVLGATATGKTDLSIFLAQKLKTQIISADSRQFYKEMNIGTAKPTIEQLEQAKHHFVDFLSINDNYNASFFENDALEVINKIFEKNKFAILTGGSGMYYRAVSEGFDNIPEVEKEISKKVLSDFNQNGLEYSLKQLKKFDPVFFQKVDKNNSRRVLRALEICIQAGAPYSDFLNKNKKKREFINLKIAIKYPRKELYERIDKRCDLMMKNGLLEEVKELQKFDNKLVNNTIGYKEFINYMEGKTTYEFALQKFKQYSRNYAKRQMTWLNRDKAIKWINFQ